MALADMVKAGLSQVERTLDGTGLAYSKLDLSGKELAALEADALSGYPHVRYFMAAGNALEVADAVAWLMGEDAGAITGQAIAVAGGEVMG